MTAPLVFPLVCVWAIEVSRLSGRYEVTLEVGKRFVVISGPLAHDAALLAVRKAQFHLALLRRSL